MADYPDAQMADNLLQERCHRFEYANAPATGDKEMTVFWEVAHNKTAEAVEFLNRWPTGNAYKADPATPTQLLTDPVVDNEPYAGKWRVARNWYDPQIPGKVFQTRRFGYLTTLLTGAAVNWSEARLVSGQDHLVWGTEETPQTDDYVLIQWRNIAPGQGPVLAKQLVSVANAGTGAWTPLGDAVKFGSSWRILPPTHETAQDGSAVLSVAFVKLGVTVIGYGNQGAEIETQTVLVRCTEDELDTKVAEIKDLGGVTDVSPSRDPQSGICQIRYTKISPDNNGVIYYRTESEPGQYEYHKLAWERPVANITTELNWSGAGFPADPGIPSIEYPIRRIASVRRNPQTARWSYHIILSDGGAQIPTANDPTAPTNALTSYRVQWFERRMWSILNNMYWDQKELTCWKHETLIFTTFATANAWVGGATAAPPSYAVDHQPYWAPDAAPLPPQEGAAFPRLVGVNKWLAQRRTVAWSTGYYPPEPT